MFNGTVVVAGKVKNRWLIITFEVLGASGSEELQDHEMRTNIFLRNAPAFISYGTFIGVIHDDEKTDSIICIELMGTRMNVFIEDLHQCLKFVGRGGK